MSDEIPAIVSVEIRPAEIVRPPLIEPPKPAAAEAAPPEQIHLVDSVFTSGRDQDSMVGLIRWIYTAPWIGDLFADHFRIPPDEEDASKKRR